MPSGRRCSTRYYKIGGGEAPSRRRSSSRSLAPATPAAGRRPPEPKRRAWSSSPWCAARTDVRRGFVDPVLGSQRVFRRVLEAMAHPGRIVTLDALLDTPASFAPASAAVCLTLLDFETPLWLDDAARAPEAMEWLRFHCGVPLVDQPEAARFALVLAPATMPENDEFDAGTDAMPDRSATLILQ